MGWKIRKDKLQSDASGPGELVETGVEPPAGAAGYEGAEGTQNSRREPYVLDLDHDAFGTKAQHTSLDPNAFSWFRSAPINSPETDEEPVPNNGFGANGIVPPSQPPQPGPFDFAIAPTQRSEPFVPQTDVPAYNAGTQPAFAEPAQPRNGTQGVPSIEDLMAPSLPAPIPAAPPPSQPTAPAPQYQPPAPQASAIPESYRPSASQTQSHFQGRSAFDTQPLGRHAREDIAPGLVRQESEIGIPKVAPFILDMGSISETNEPVEQPTLVMRFKNLTARYTIQKAVTTLGRPDSDTGNYPDIEIEMDEGVSRKHAEIRLRDSRYYLIDVGSTNGTLLNGQAVIALTENVLTHGDRIRIGEMTEIVFE